MAFSFDSTQVEGGEFDLIPTGRFNFIIEECVEKTTKDTGNVMISFKFKIITGMTEGRVIYENFVVGHPQYGDAARRKLKAICEACDYLTFHDTKELEGKVLNAKITHAFDKNKGDYVAKISDFKAFNFGIDDQVTQAHTKSSTQSRPTTHTKPAQQPKEIEDDVPF